MTSESAGKSECFPTKMKNKIDCPFWSFIFSVVLENLARAIRQEKEIIASRLEKWN